MNWPSVHLFIFILNILVNLASLLPSHLHLTSFHILGQLMKNVSFAMFADDVANSHQTIVAVSAGRMLAFEYYTANTDKWSDTKIHT